MTKIGVDYSPRHLGHGQSAPPHRNSALKAREVPPVCVHQQLAHVYGPCGTLQAADTRDQLVDVYRLVLALQQVEQRVRVGGIQVHGGKPHGDALVRHYSAQLAPLDPPAVVRVRYGEQVLHPTLVLLGGPQLRPEHDIVVGMRYFNSFLNEDCIDYPDDSNAHYKLEGNRKEHKPLMQVFHEPAANRRPVCQCQLKERHHGAGERPEVLEQLQSDLLGQVGRRVKVRRTEHVRDDHGDEHLYEEQEQDGPAERPGRGAERCHHEVKRIEPFDGSDQLHQSQQLRGPKEPQQLNVDGSLDAAEYDAEVRQNHHCQVKMLGRSPEEMPPKSCHPQDHLERKYNSKHDFSSAEHMAITAKKNTISISKLGRAIMSIEAQLVPHLRTHVLLLDAHDDGVEKNQCAENYVKGRRRDNPADGPADAIRWPAAG
mmetsp:Transcript_33221/g.88933  ORF Transcript_33221/g.88933 Transcript_33221/m.88933 type:complete len:428 (-) Transcript_33221:364-1647(-)